MTGAGVRGAALAIHGVHELGALGTVMRSPRRAVLLWTGWFGALDVALGAGLIAAGAASATAVAVVLGYRLVTVWAPLVPGAFLFEVLLQG